MNRTLLMFTGQCASATAGSNGEAVLMVDSQDQDAVLVYDIYGVDGLPDMDRVRSLFGPEPRRHRFAGMATRVNWSPTATGDSSPAWCLVCVGRGEQARLVVKCDGDERWTMLNMSDAPWFAASTAAALRAMLDGDFGSPFRHLSDPRLLDPVLRSNAPAARPDGRL